MRSRIRTSGCALRAQSRAAQPAPSGSAGAGAHPIALAGARPSSSRQSAANGRTQIRRFGPRLPEVSPACVHPAARQQVPACPGPVWVRTAKGRTPCAARAVGRQPMKSSRAFECHPAARKPIPPRRPCRSETIQYRSRAPGDRGAPCGCSRAIIARQARTSEAPDAISSRTSPRSSSGTSIRGSGSVPRLPCWQKRRSRNPLRRADFIVGCCSKSGRTWIRFTTLSAWTAVPPARSSPKTLNHYAAICGPIMSICGDRLANA